MAIYNYPNNRIIRKPPFLNLQKLHGLEFEDVRPLLYQGKQDIQAEVEAIKTVFQHSYDEFQDWVSIKPRTQKQKFIAAYALFYRKEQANSLLEWDDCLTNLDIALSGAEEEQYPIGGEITSLMVERARAYPMEKIYPGELVETGSEHYRGLCPFHDEKTPSFYIYPADAKYPYPHFYCFASKTAVLTKSGETPIDELVGRKSTILNGNGRWEDTTFVPCGKQRLYCLVIRRGSETKQIFVTGDHQWFVQGKKTTYQTQHLKRGLILESIYDKNNLPTSFSPWQVERVEQTKRLEMTYCCETSTGSFALAGNIKTHNCFGCHKFGTAISLYMKIKHKSYEQTVKDLGRLGH